jgi:hypothetical protein
VKGIVKEISNPTHGIFHLGHRHQYYIFGIKVSYCYRGISIDHDMPPKDRSAQMPRYAPYAASDIRQVIAQTQKTRTLPSQT